MAGEPANLENKTPINPNKTLFHVGSISKLLTATAIMQLSERRLIKLDEDVNKYLKEFQLEKKYQQPVTFANLLTHTSGFDDKNIGTAARKVSEVKPLGKYLKEQISVRVVPPGRIISYSSQGISLAGYLIEVISGLPFAQYINKNIFNPLGMNHSSFLQPLSKSLETDLVTGYQYRDGKYQKTSLNYFNVAPAEALKTTASDMARFMIANLQNGRYQNSRILTDATAKQMHQSHFRYHPQLPGFAYGFYERIYNNQRAIVQNGDLYNLSNYLILVPEAKLGLFVANNSSNPDFNQEIITAFFDRYYPVEEKKITVPHLTTSQEQLKQFTGSYRYMRYSRKSIEKLNTLFSQPDLFINKDGMLIFEGSKLVQIEPLLFQKNNNGDYVLFKRSENMITNLFVKDFGYEKLPWYEYTIFQLSILVGFLLVFAYGCIIWFRREQPQCGRVNRMVKVLAGLICTLNFVFIVGIAVSFLLINPIEFDYGLPWIIFILLHIPLLSTSITIGVSILTVIACTNRYFSIKQRIHHLLIEIASLGFIPFLSYWNLLYFHL